MRPAPILFHNIDGVLFGDYDGEFQLVRPFEPGFHAGPLLFIPMLKRKLNKTRTSPTLLGAGPCFK